MAASFRVATAEDAQQWYGRAVPVSFRGYVAEVAGEVVAIGGVFFMDGIPIAFSEMKEGKRLDRKSIALGIRLLIKFIDSNYKIVFAFANQKEKSAERLLKKLGFVMSGGYVEGYGLLYVRKSAQA